MSLTKAFMDTDPTLASCTIGIDLKGAFYTANYGGQSLDQTADVSCAVDNLPAMKM